MRFWECLLGGESQQARLVAPVERQLHADQLFQRQIGRLVAIENRSLNRRRQVCEVCPGPDIGLGDFFAAGDLRNRRAALEIRRPSVPLCQSTEKRAVRSRHHVADYDSALNTSPPHRERGRNRQGRLGNVFGNDLQSGRDFIPVKLHREAVLSKMSLPHELIDLMSVTISKTLNKIGHLALDLVGRIQVGRREQRMPARGLFKMICHCFDH